MSEKMVRTQVYLPRGVYEQLQQRAERHGLTLALQIREALEGYLLRGTAEEDEMEPLDLGNLFEILDELEASGGSGLPDSAINHDKYIYGDPHGEQALKRERARAPLKLQAALATREGAATYKTEKRRTKRSGRRA